MDNKRKLVSLLKQRLSGKLLFSVSHRDDETVIEIEKNNLPEVCYYLCKELDGRLVTMVGCDEREYTGTFTLYYVFAFSLQQYFIIVKTQVSESDPTYPSCSVEIPALNWYEREVRDLMGLRALGHPDSRPLILHGDWPEDCFPLRKDFTIGNGIPRVESRERFMEYEGGNVTQVPVGPIHAGIIEPGHFRFGTVGDTILYLDAQLFYTHRGLEKSAEGKTLLQGVYLAERICGVCSLSHAAAYVQAVERASGIKVPERALFLRTLFLELERLYNHVGDVGNICAGFGFAVATSNGSRMKEGLLALNERLTGSRYLRGTVKMGGCKIDLSVADCLDIGKMMDRLEKDFSELVDIILSHDIATNRMQGTGILTLEQANDLEVVGVAARASGRDVDMRRDFPYAAYDRVSFEVPLYKDGDVLARIRIRMDEVFQSINIIRQVLDMLPLGDICGKCTGMAEHQWGIGWTESARGETVHWIMAGAGQTIERYRIRSATYSNWPAVPLTVKKDIVPDFPLINKSFELCYSCCDR